MKKNLLAIFLLTAACFYFLPAKPPAPVLEQYIEIELKRLEETYRLIDQLGESVWPGWNNHLDVEFRVQFPNQVHLLVNPRKKAPKGYEKIQGRTIRGKEIFINRQDKLPLALKPPLIGGGGGGLTIKIRLRQIEVPDPPQKKEPHRYSDDQVLLYIHEFFHGFQRRCEFRENDDALYEFMSNTGYAACSNIEALALMNAYDEHDNSRALEYLKDYLAARALKKQFMPPDAMAAEKWVTVSEGTASYANIKMAMLLRGAKYKTAMTQKDDPFFYEFKFMDQYLREHTEEEMQAVMENTLDIISKCYIFGAYQCLLLDRFVPGWKQVFFQQKKTLDDMLENFILMSPEQKEAVTARLKTRYPYDEIFAKHQAVITERDNALEAVKKRKGVTYIIDMIKIREFPRAKPRGRAVNIKGIEMIFPNGIEELKLGDIELTSVDTPVRRSWLRTYEWIDSEAAAGKKGYQMTFEKKEGEIFKNLVFKTAGFTLKAPGAKVVEDRDKNQVRIVILSKMSR
jgi:hypothetical protein